MPVATEPEFDMQLLQGIRTALRKARELGYHVEDIGVTASVSEGVCNVHFAPLCPPGYIMAGGDLTVTVNPVRDEVTDFKRGQ